VDAAILERRHFWNRAKSHLLGSRTINTGIHSGLVTIASVQSQDWTSKSSYGWGSLHDLFSAFGGFGLLW
jgi:hypothetical protein